MSAPLWRKVTVAKSGCWHIPNRTLSNGYVPVVVEHRRTYAHRLYYELHKGPIPAGYTIDHLCHSNDPDCPGGVCVHRRCVNPDHLEAVTVRENLLRGKGWPAINAAKTHCSRAGHPLSGDNLFVNTNGARVCRACVRADQPRNNRNAYLKRKARDRVTSS